MKISIITVFPELHELFIKTSIIGRAVEKGRLEFNIVRFSDMCSPKERIDEPTVGPGVGMIIKPAIVQRAIDACENKLGPGFKIFFSPQGVKLDQRKLVEIAQRISTGTIALRDARANAHTPQGDRCDSKSTRLSNPDLPEESVGALAKTDISKGEIASPHLILVCSRYEGIDARVEEHYADLVISIGDYVVMGGDLPAQIFLEGLLRLIPGIVGKQESVAQDSFQTSFLDHPEYGLPVTWEGKTIPTVLRSGNHAEIDSWRKNAAAQKTILNRFDWFSGSQLTPQDTAHAIKFIPPHYIALMHTDVNLKEGRVGTTSIASLDIHDTARACATYAVKNLFIVTPLHDQQEVAKTFLSFWRSEQGTKYNPSRQQAVNLVQLVTSFDHLVSTIEQQERARPFIVTTSAKAHAFGTTIDYQSQAEVWRHRRPVLFVFGTGQGLSNNMLAKSDYALIPVQGLSTYNHLSVRSAVSIILDRWLGLHPHLNHLNYTKNHLNKDLQG
jgi:tRNA (guanine37-N1)-methyltransferase